MHIRKALGIAKKRIDWLRKRIKSAFDTTKVSYDVEEAQALEVLVEIAENYLDKQSQDEDRSIEIRVFRSKINN